MKLKRRNDQARAGFDIVGITANEIPFTDADALMPGVLKTLADPDWQTPFDQIDIESEDASEQTTDPSPVMQALDRLQPRWKQAVELHIERMTQKEAAKIMGVKQPRYFEILRGKDGKSGALGRLRGILVAEGYAPKALDKGTNILGPL